MRRYQVFAVGLSCLCVTAVAALLGPIPQAAPNCADCTPAPYNFSPSGSFSIGFDAGFTSEEKAGIVSGASGYWNGVFSQQSVGVSISSQEASYASANIKFTLDPSLVGQSIVAIATINGDGTGSVRVNPDKLNNARSQTYWKWSGAHEVGHLMGHQDVGNKPQGSCFGLTIMYETIYSNIDSFPSSLCSDQLAVANKHSPGNYNPCDYGCPAGYTQSCVGDQQPDPNNCNCCINYTPVLVDLLGDGIDMSGLEDGVTYQINAAGSRLKLGWPVGPDDVWLALDRNGNGTIDHGGELFGNTTPQKTGGFAPNGYEALADLDENGDSWVDADDAQFDRILVWSDGNRNGVAEPSEVRSAIDAGIRRIGTRYRESRRQDQWGNKFKYVGRVETIFGGRRSVDVYPAAEPCGS